MRRWIRTTGGCSGKRARKIQSAIRWRRSNLNLLSIYFFMIPQVFNLRWKLRTAIISTLSETEPLVIFAAFS